MPPQQPAVAHRRVHAPPVLRQDGSRLDWTRASYEATVALRGTNSAVIHQLRHAPELENLIAQGAAAFATEIRCPRTMHSRVETAQGNEQTLQLDGHRNDSLYISPGIVALRDDELSTAGLGPHLANGAATIAVREGWWLAQGGQFSFVPLLAGMLRFVRDADGELGEGRMTVEEAGGAMEPHFMVTLAAKLYDERRESRDVHIAALIAAFGLLPASSLASGGPNSGCPLDLALRARLDESSVPDWDDAQMWDPALAATAIEPFWLDTALVE